MSRWARVLMVAAILVDLFAAGMNIAQGRPWWGLLWNLATAALAALVWWWGERRIRRDRARSSKLIIDSYDARPPEGVRVRRADGTEIACELVYRGRNGESIHIWEVAGMVLGPNDRVLVDAMPGYTGIEWVQHG